MVIPALRLDLHVLTQHIEAHALRLLNIIAQRVVRRRAVQPIWPPPLVQEPDLEIWLVVQEQPIDAGAVAGDGDLTHANVALDLVTVTKRNLKVVEKRLRRGPESGVGDR